MLKLEAIGLHKTGVNGFGKNKHLEYQPLPNVKGFYIPTTFNRLPSFPRYPPSSVIKSNDAAPIDIDSYSSELPSQPASSAGY